LEVIMPIGFVGPALQGASLIGRVGIPLLQQAGIGLGMAGIGAGVSALTNKPQAKPQPTGRQKLAQSWGTIPDSLNAPQGGGFGYSRGGGRPAVQPSYQDAQGNIYDAVSGRLLYPAKSSTSLGAGAGSGSSLVGGGSSAADRAYESEKSRVAQLTAQDPEFQRYEKARQLAVGPNATPEQVQSAEDIGMAMWARANPQLAAKVKPGQAGYDVVQGTLAGQAAAQGYGFQMPQQIMTTPPPGVNAPQGLPAVQSFSPTSTYGAQGLEIDPEMAKKFQALLNQTKA
jgi:hypothetical protein